MNMSPKTTGRIWCPRLIDRAHRFFEQGQWAVDLGGLSTFRALGVKATRVLSLAWHGMVSNDCLTRASALTYITVLSLVPLLAFAFSMAKGFGAYERLMETTITPFLEEMAPVAAGSPTGLQVDEGAQQIRAVVEGLLDFVANTNFANLGLVGLIFLMFTSLRLMTTVETTFNAIWGLHQARPLMRKVTDFTALVVVTPILLLVATTVTLSLQSNALTEFMTNSLNLGFVVRSLSRLIPVVMVWLGFTFLYMVMPNTRVPFVSALVGGVVGGTIWQIVQVLHVTFQIGVASYNAIYAGFAAFPLFLVWVYMNWVAMLLGGLVAWAHQTEPAYRAQKRAQATTLADREFLALRALAFIATEFAQNRGLASTDAVAAHCGVPPGVLQDVVRPLVEAGLIAQTSNEESQGFLPARRLSEIRVDDVLRALRGRRHDGLEDGDRMSQALERLQAAVASSHENVTMDELIDRSTPAMP